MMDSNPRLENPSRDPDLRLETDYQADPYLDEGRVTPARIGFFGAAGAVIVALVLWGLNAPSKQETAATGTPTSAAPSTTAANAGAEKPASPGAPESGRGDSSASTGRAAGSMSGAETTGQGGADKQPPAAAPSGKPQNPPAPK